MAVGKMQKVKYRLQNVESHSVTVGKCIMQKLLYVSHLCLWEGIVYLYEGAYCMSLVRHNTPIFSVGHLC